MKKKRNSYGNVRLLAAVTSHTAFKITKIFCHAIGKKIRGKHLGACKKVAHIPNLMYVIIP